MIASTSPDATVFPHEIQHAPIIRPENENETSSSNASDASVRVVVQRPHKRFFLTPLILRPSATSREVMRELLELRNQELSRITPLKPIRQLLWKCTIEFVNLSSFHMPNIVTQPGHDHLEVILSSRAVSAELTAAFHHAWLLQSSTSFADQHPAFPSSSSLPTTLLIGQELNKAAFFWVLLAAMLVFLGAGLLIGFLSSRADLAIAITTGLTGMVSVFTVLLIWILE